MPAVSLYTVSAVIVLDNEGNRLLAKYYGRDELSESRRRQETFESLLFTRTRKAPNNEVVMCEGKIVVYRTNLDLMICVVGLTEQNELMLATVLDTFTDVLTDSLKPQLDKRAFLENYDVAALLLDECVDRGIIMESDAGEIVSRGARSPSSFGDMHFNEQTISSAFSFAKQQIKTFLR